MNEDQVIQSLAALAHPVRLRVFRALVVAGAGGLTPSVLAEQLDVAGTALSFHLKELVRAGLVTQERSSRNLIYRAAYAQMDAVLGYLTENCCAGADCGQALGSCCPGDGSATSTPSACG
ncbi:ArsR/SmtB family transcription factor [Comamonas sp. UBA7528]|jgi:DNA-binding transcriptional ArsR family regulator|uniref:ArsR/SmtB family transcription factor n=1 Tax=Comamonas sp. UBA7528 TaxID=1946391 RepID=UPI0025B7F314|nr:helix-turn-helix domain-containing protein [Comamonas sp. UBA7528]